MKKIILFTLFFAANGWLLAQKMTIAGKATDTAAVALVEANVLLLDPADTTLITYARTGLDGSFEFKNIKKRDYLVKITYVGYIPAFVLAQPTSAAVLDLGSVRLKEINSQLMEVVIRTAKAPISIRGDTIEYDASTFKVPPGASVEDLLRKLPGIEVAADGSLKAEGQTISQVTVDGKRFFGSDPKAATKNLPAEGISKVQIFNQETEEKKLTGSTATPTDKTMNLQLKEDFKRGGFGKVVAGIGTDQRAELKGNYNKFDDKQQFSLVGVGNNTGRNGLSWDDYQDFRGSQAFNWDDGEDFGFGSSRNFRSFSTSDDDEDGGSFSDSFFGQSGAGFPKNYSGGANYNYDHKKLTFSGLYYYDQVGLEAVARRTQKNFLPDRTYFNNDFSENNRLSRNHRTELRLEHAIDSFNTIVASSNFSYNRRKDVTESDYLYTRADGTKSNRTNLQNNFVNNALFWKSSAVYRKKFRKKGRSLGVSASFFLNNTDKSGEQIAQNQFFNAAEQLDSLKIIDQTNVTVSMRRQIKANALFVEPLSKKFSWQTFYNFSNRLENGDRQVFDILNAEPRSNDFLTRFYDNSIINNRLGTMVRYAHKGINFSTGAAWQTFNVRGNYSGGATSGIVGVVDRTFTNWLPNVSFDASPMKNGYVDVSYSASATEPSVRNLQPIVDNSNPLLIRVGNANLQPELAHEVSVRFRRFVPANFINFNVNFSYSAYENQFITTQKVDARNVTTSQPINYSGGSSINSNANFGFPIVKNKFTINVSYNISQSKSFAFVNEVRNKTRSASHRPGIRLSLTPIDNFSLYANANLGITNTSYDINVSQNQLILNQNYAIELNAGLPKGFYFNSKFDYSRFQNRRFNFDQQVPIWNVSLYKVFLKNNRGELRLSCYDVLNRNISIRQVANANLVSETRTNALGRYAMLSFTYNLRGINVDIKKSGRGGIR